MSKVESFLLDHTKVKAPYIRIAGKEKQGNVNITKYDLRLVQPNLEEIPTGALHTLEHLIATKLRDELEGIIDISPMGCRTGFYLVLWGEYKTSTVKNALTNVLKFITIAKKADIPAVSAKECGNYRDHSLFGAQEYAKQILAKKISSDPFMQK
ncbi:MAG: S-ribosylhomocysteine lyase [Streptococcaceae bacterium]|jgi:S-ribosylhomocysteine lyase|nr:S-ribosylhomocysteine lyase [Streptococcaceae bacterium]